MMKSVILLIILSLFFVGCNSDKPKLSSIGSIDSGSTTAPYITNVAVPANGIYVAASTMDFYVTFNKTVSVTGTPKLLFVSDTGGVVAYYVDGSGTNILHFSVNVPAGVIDDNGIVLSQIINTTSGSIVDAVSGEDARLTFTPPATWGIMINAGDPYINSILPPAAATYVASQTLRFTVNFNARVCGTGTPRLRLNVGGTTRYASWVTSACNTTMYFDYTVIGGDVDADGVDLTGTAIDMTFGPGAFKDSFMDSANVGYMATTFADVKVNGVLVPPTELAKNVPANGTYKIGDTIYFKLNYNENVHYMGGFPELKLNIGINIRSADYFSGSGTSTITFAYTIIEGDEDTDGIAIGSMQYNGASLLDSDNLNAPYTAVWPSVANIKVDGVRPVISSIGTPANGLYFSTGPVTAQVNWSESVIFVGGTPTLKMNIDSDATLKSATATLHSGSTTTFSYTIQATDADFNGMTVPANALTLAGGVTVTDVAGNLATNLTSLSTPTQAKIIPDGVQHWYDPTNSVSFGTSSGTTLNQLNDLIGSTNFNIVDPPTWDGTPKRINFADVIDYITVGPFASLNKVYIVMETKAVTPYQLFMSNASSLLYVDLENNIVTASFTCGNCAKFFNGTAWVNTNAITGNFGAYTNNSKKIIMLDYMGIANADLIFGSGFAGYIHEIFLLDGSMNATTGAPGFYRALQKKHSGATAP